jgi:DUF4097 and DUF4098 domain-containing protein YvlB
MKTRILIVAAIVAAAVAADAANVRKHFRVENVFELREGGALVVENPNGDIEIIGTDNPGADTVVTKTVIGVNAEAVEEGRQNTALIVGGDDKTRVLRAAIPLLPSRKWSSRVAWRIKVPKSTHIRIVSNSSDRIRVANILGNVVVKNINGQIVLENVSGAATVESVNGSLVYATARPQRPVTLSTVNGHISVRVHPDADIRFIADTVKGELVSNLPVRGAFDDRVFRGSLNAPAGPAISVGTLMGNVELLSNGPQVSTPVSLRAKFPAPRRNPDMQVVSGSAPGGRPSRQEVRLPLVEGNYRYATSIGDVRIQEIRGEADIFTGAGEVQLGSVSSSLKVRSHGGPLHLGDIAGPLTATTRAGSITVDAARRGGEIATQGGTIRLLYAGGPTRLVSGGGDITVRKANAPINALTSSGDIFITMDPSAKAHAISATSEKGNVVMHVSSKFGADVDATILTSDPASHAIVSEVAGLSISREQVGNKTRIRATGKINGGGDRMELNATDGGIRITTGPPRTR